MLLSPGPVPAADLAELAGTGFAASVAIVAGRVLLIIALALIARRLATVLIRRVVHRIETEGERRSARPERAALRATTLGDVLGNLATAIIATLAALMLLGQVGVSVGPLIAGAGIVGVALGFGAQRLVQDFLSGIFMLLEDQYGTGDIVDTGEVIGTVEGITLRLTRVRDVAGTLWHVPNGDIRRVGNFTRDWARAILDVGVAYDTDVAHATEVIDRTANAFAQEESSQGVVLAEPEVWGVQDLGADEVTIRVVAQTAPAQQWAVTRELRARVKDALDAAGIEIPFPQRTVWLRHEAPDGSERGTGWSPASPAPPASPVSPAAPPAGVGTGG